MIHSSNVEIVNRSVCVFVYVYIFMCMCSCLCADAYCACVCAGVEMCMYTCVCRCRDVEMCMCVCAGVWICMRVCRCGRHSVFLWELKTIWLTQNLFWTNKCVNCGVHLPIHTYFQYRLLYKQLLMVVLLSGGLSLPTFWLRFLGVLTCLLFPGLQHGSECLLIPGLSSLSSLALGIAALSIRSHIKCFSLGRASLTIIQVSAFYFPQALCYTIYLYLKYSLAHAQAYF